MSIFPREVQKYTQTIPNVPARAYAIAYALYCLQGRQIKVHAKAHGLRDDRLAANIRTEVERLLREA